MAIAPRLELRQGQSLVMTPQLQQAIKLLQLSNVELAEFVETELERNPLLERAEIEQDPRGVEAPAEAPSINETDHALDVDASDLNPDFSSPDLADVCAAPLADWSKASSGKNFEDLPGFEETLANDISLAEHLDAQLTAAGVDAIQRMIGAAP